MDINLAKRVIKKWRIRDKRVMYVTKLSNVVKQILKHSWYFDTYKYFGTNKYFNINKYTKF